jgi:methylamine dehydrogenase light chain
MAEFEAKTGIDGWSERSVRRLAGGTSRRGVLSKLGLAIVAAPVFPLLPIERAKAQTASSPPPGTVLPDLTDFQKKAQTKDDTECNYWRYCAIDGSLCSCCGGGVSSCPPGAEPSPVSWVGTCINPDDGKAYLIAYRDCCGKSTCGQCGCDNADRETPLYVPQLNNNVLWCFGTKSKEYHCSTGVLVGKAQ